MSVMLKKLIENIPDFPKSGILFRDISPLLAQKFPETIDAMLALFSDTELKQTQSFAGIDSRGFLFAAALAAKTDKNVMMVRKAGKLPPPTLTQSYDLEYGSASIEMRPSPSQNIIIVDDVLATGGTMEAACKLCDQAGHNIIGTAALINLTFLNNFKWNNQPTKTVFSYDD